MGFILRNLFYGFLATIALLCAFGAYSKYQSFVIEQEVCTSFIDGKTQLRTLVWHKFDILEAWYDPIENADEELISYRYKQAERFIEKVKESKEAIDKVKK